jgi:hypothetical protein
VAQEVHRTSLVMKEKTDVVTNEVRNFLQRIRAA